MGTDANPIVEAPAENQETESMESNGTENESNESAEYFEEEKENEESGELQAERISGSDEQN